MPARDVTRSTHSHPVYWRDRKQASPLFSDSHDFANNFSNGTSHCAAVIRQCRAPCLSIVRPLLLVEPKAPAAWANWWTYQYGPDLLVSPIWEKGKRTQEVYLPSGQKWRDAWRPDKTYEGGQTIAVAAELHQIPLFVRAGSNVELGDLNREYAESKAQAEKKPDLKPLDAQTKAWLEKK